MISRRAQCSCGQLSATCSGEPLRVSVCHCLNCKRRTGSAFSHNARFAEASVSVQGRSSEFTLTGDEGSRATFSFCADCGTTVYYRNDRMPGMIAIPVGGFADLDFPAPGVSVYHDSRRYPWVEIRTAPLETLG
jgi:hypothetical protein